MQYTKMNKIENYFEVFLIIFLILLFLYIIKNYLVSIFLAATFVFLFYKPYKKLSRNLNKTFTTIFILFVVLIIIIFPLYLLSITLVQETSNLIVQGNNLIKSFELSSCNYDFCKTIERNIVHLDSIFNKILAQLGNTLASTLYSIFSSITQFVINVGIFVLSFFFLLRDGDKFLAYIKKIIPMQEEYKNSLFYRFREVTLAVFIDAIFVAIIQGFLLGVGFKIVNINAPILWGTIAAFFALIPMIGTTIVWIPAVIYLLLTSNYISAGILLVYSMIVVGLSDNVIRTIMLNRRIKVHPLLIFISVMGGLNVFGFFGLFLGPIVISLLITVLQLYRLDFK